ncbi:hypothetical protein N7468_009258 [Penicillium chermesinum]|uniref:Uncharacterized protein n=1 Tax=Penicillium chermesinum TaxID=63820 RepID=A0A9W9TF31_9EURO|nr:uncharacterized protein N7468_009258 [Penicillium chermesinum]KAJ5220054.1 hypothetical protein N7468_009258 [Penicillium chermesinum]
MDLEPSADMDKLDLQAERNYDELGLKMDELIDALASHPEVQPPTPHPTAFFLLSFIRATREHLRNIDFQKLAEGGSKESQALRDVIGRNWFANMILNDQSGALSLVTPGDGSHSIQIGPDIKAKAKALHDFWGLKSD